MNNMCNTPKISHIYYICTTYVKAGGTFHSVVGIIMNGIMLQAMLFCRGGYGLIKLQTLNSELHLFDH